MIAEKAGYRQIVLELGGNSPLIVMEDADLDRAATLAVAGATKNSGQRCTAVKRILVIDPIANDSVRLVTVKAKKLKYGDPMNSQTDVGTVINEQSAILFQHRVEDAVTAGAKLLHGNNHQGVVFPLTVVDHVSWDCELVMQETFGPAIPIIRIQDVNEAIQVANGTILVFHQESVKIDWTISPASLLNSIMELSIFGRSLAIAVKCRYSEVSRALDWAIRRG